MPDNESYCVYRHTAPNGKVYIGITSQVPTRRWAGGHGYRHNPYFSKAIKKYGWDVISHEVLFSGLSKEEACVKEIALIEFHRSNDEKYGYNLSSGGESPSQGIKHSEEARAKMSLAMRSGKAPWKGKTFSLEHRRKLSEAHRGLKMSPETCVKQSVRQMGEKNHNYGKRASEETRRKMGDAHRKYSVVQMTLAGEAIQTYPSVAAVVKELNCSKTTITNACSGRRPQALGYKWKYESIKEE